MLVKYVISTIPIHLMSIYLLLVSLSFSLHSLVQKFLWIGSNDKRFTYHIPRSMVYKPKSLGGLRFRSFSLMKKAMVAKLGCALMVQKNKLWVQPLKVKYFPQSNFLRCAKAKRCSLIWTGIFESREFLQLAACFYVGSKTCVSLQNDLWIPFIFGFKPTPRDKAHLTFNEVVAGLKHIDGRWNSTMLNQLFDSDTIRTILAMQWVDA